MTTSSAYEKCLQEMYSLHRFGIKLGLDLISGMLRGLGNPQETYHCIHIAGTNGKGSVASALSTILHRAGYRTGLYTSPHLVSFNERICINNKPVADDDIVAAHARATGAFKGDRENTFFELSTAMALDIFGRKEVDWAIIETGMGGRLDATNVLNPDLCVITNISLEHQSYLGDTIAQIAGEKGGIIKQGVPVVTGVRQPEAIATIDSLAREKEAPLARFKETFDIRPSTENIFDYQGIATDLDMVAVGLPGEHQLENAALVLAACETLNLSGKTKIEVADMRHGLMENNWPGRLEIVAEAPTILLDGAHNLVACEALAHFLKTRMAGRNITLVVGILDDKPYEQMLDLLVPHCKKLVLTRPVIDRALEPEALLPVVQPYGKETTIITDVPDAANHAIDSAAPEDVVCIAGSLYVVGEARQMLDITGRIN
jgi:dihydrofolate synthase/folylpolyglutamate synthase